MNNEIKNRWISVSEDLVNIVNERVDKKDRESLDEVNFDLFLTPMYAPLGILPHRVKNKHNKKIERLVIKFKYVISSDEDHVIDKSNKIIHFEVGKSSGKIYRIQIDVPEFQKQHPNTMSFIDDMEELINQALIDLADRDDKVESERPGFISQLLKDHRDAIFHDLTAA